MTAAPPLQGLRISAAQLQSIGWQVLGSAATLAAAGWVSWTMGLAAQGEFGLAKAWFDGSAALLGFGIPQGLLHLLYRRRVPGSELQAWLLRRAAALALLAWPIAAACFWMAASGSSADSQWRLAALVAAAAPFGVAHLATRSVLLAGAGVAVFGFTTALPALLVLAGVVALALAGATGGFAEVLLVAAAVAAVVSAVLAHRIAPPGAATVDWSRAELWSVSLQSWVQLALGALMPALLLSLAAGFGASAEGLGRASLGLHLFQVFAVLAGYLGPLVFDRVAGAGAKRPVGLGPTAHLALRAAAWCAFAIELVLLAVLGAVDGDAAALVALAAMLVPAGIAAFASRLLAAYFQASGDYRELSLQAVWRAVFVVLVFAALTRLFSPELAVGGTLLVVELGTLLRMAVALRRQVGSR